jgi:exodeoxyribonuclease VII large subunit
LPRRIGLITSPSGAAAHDVLSILRRRWPLAHVLFIPSAVQGFNAVPELLRALNWAAAVEDLDAVIIGRGGGSAEDLWAFNDEELVRAAAQFPHPLISAVGHETDFTLLDFVADLRAPTPSAAAELVVPNQREVAALLSSLRLRMRNAVAGDVELARQRLDALRSRRVLARPAEQLVPLRERVASYRRELREALSRRVKIEKQNVQAKRAQLSALDPRRVLERGYALVSDAQSGRLLGGIEDAVGTRTVSIALRDGLLHAQLQDSEEV